MENNSIAVNVAVRVRPLFRKEVQNVVNYITEGESPVLIVSDRRNAFTFDYVFSNEVHQCEIYNVLAKPFLLKVLEGYNCTILAYGQTGTGKTYTMGTDSNTYHNIDSGIIPRVLEEFFEIANQDHKLKVSISFTEIYNEKVYDLLSSSRTALKVKGFNVTGMTCVPVESNEDARHCLLVGGKGRHVRHTALNVSSSRSHAIFTIYCTDTNTGTTSKLHLVDLAGSESVRRTGNQGTAFQEGVTINKGLLAIGRVIHALSDKRIAVIPYRDSILTTILHDSLTTNNFVSLLACVSPNEKDVSETLATLRFAVKAKSLKSCPQVESTISELYLKNVKSTVKKKRKLPEIFTSTQVKKPLLNMKNSSLVHTSNKKFTSPNFLSTVDTSSILTSTIIDKPKQNLNISPVIQQCTLGIETILQDQITSKLNSSLKNKTNKENTPAILHWPAIEERLTTIIRRELSQLNINTSVLKRSNKDSNSVVKELVFDSPLASELEKSKTVVPKKPIDKVPDESLFKVPNVNIQRVKNLERNSISVDTSPILLRRSVRLSIKALNDFPTPAPRYSIIKSKNKLNLNISSPFKLRRRSVRLSLKRAENTESLKSPPIPAPRRLLRNQTLSEYLKVPIKKNCITKNSDNSRTQHELNVLRLLNFGKQKDIQTLATVGVKTALQILTYRSLNGEFKKLEDLRNIPTWGDKKFEKFIFANQLQ